MRGVGFLVMAGVAALVGWLVAKLIGTVAGVAVGLLFFVAWFRFNRRQGTVGLFRANLGVYLTSRQRGQSIDQALRWMVLTRYGFSEQKQAQAPDLISRLPPTEREDQKVMEAVFLIFCMEQGVPPDLEWQDKYRRQIAEVYGKMSGQPVLP